MTWTKLNPPKKNLPKQSQSIIKKLRAENRSNDEFEIFVSQLTLEELIWLKLELSAKLFADNKFYGFPLWHSFPNIVRESLIKFAIFATSTKPEAARFLGVNVHYLEKIIKKFNIN